MKIFRGKETQQSKHDTFHELLDIWNERGYCEVINEETQDYFTWANEVGDILLYDFDTYREFPYIPDNWKHALFGGEQHPNGKPWVYWGRSPRLLDEQHREKPKKYNEREIESIFLGKVENPNQLKNRTKENWPLVIEEFSMPIAIGDSFNWPYTKEEYLDKIANSKFGLCLPGFCLQKGKCNREIELLALGTVPLFTPGVCNIYHNNLVEGVHFFRVNNIEDVLRVFDYCGEDRWEEMSFYCREWYKKNASPEGSYLITEEIINSFNE